MAALRFGFGERQLERIGFEEQGVRQWKGIEVVYYALDRMVWQARGKR